MVTRFSFISILFCILLAAAKVSAAGVNAVSVEVAGRGGLFSLNFDTALVGSLYLGGGISHWRTATADASVSVTIIPIYANYYFMESVHRVFVTAAEDIVSSSGAFNAYGFRGSGALFLPGVGYEYRDDAGFLFRGALYYIIGPNAPFSTGGFSAGYNF